MKNALLFTFAILLLLPVFVKADGMPMPVSITHYSSIQEKQQYAEIEVINDSFEKINLYLSFKGSSLEKNNITVIIPLKSLPEDVSLNKTNSSDFLNKYGFDDIKELIDKQSSQNFSKAFFPKLRDDLGEYFMLSLFSPLYEIRNLGSGAMMTQASLPSGITKISSYEFEGTNVDIYNVTSGQTLEEFVKNFYNIDMPQKVKDAIDYYKSYYIVVLNVENEPINVSFLNQSAPSTLKEAIEYVKNNPTFNFTCYGWGGCSDRDVIKSKFSDLIGKAETEARTRASLGQVNLSDIEIPIDIPNAGFEEGISYWKDYSGGLTSNGTKTCNYGIGGYKIDSSTSKSGNFSLYIYAPSDCPVIFCRSFSVTLDKKYVASIWKKGDVWSFLSEMEPTAGYSSYCNNSHGTTYLTAEDLSNWREDTVNCSPTYYSPSELYFCLGQNFASSDPTSIDSGWVDDLKIYQYISIDDQIEDAMIDFFLSSYSNTTKGIELSLATPLENNEIFYPLGTGASWSTPIEDTKVLVKMDKELVANFANVQYSAIDNNNRYYLWTFENQNPTYDLVGAFNKPEFSTSVSDFGKTLIMFLNENLEAFTITSLLIIILIGILLVIFKGKGDKKKRTIFALLMALFSPIISIWLVILLSYLRKIKYQNHELEINILIFLGIIFLFWVFTSILSFI